MPSLFSHSSLHSIKRASCPCPDYQLQLTLINMRVGVMWYRASHARRLWQTEHTAGGIQEGKNERGSRGGWLEAENAQLRGMVAELMLEIQVLREALPQIGAIVMISE